MYSSALLRYFENLRNSGDLPGAQVRVIRENPVCGDVLELSLKLTNDGLIESRFKAQGCVPAIACASAVTELIAERSVEIASRLKREDLIRAVDGVPAASSHAIDLALEALRAAIKQLS